MNILAAAGHCSPLPGGDVGVVVPKSVVTTAHSLGFAPGSLEYQWMADALNLGRVEELKAFLDQHKLGLLEVTPEARAFGRQAVHAWMSDGEVSFEDHVHLENEVNQPCVKDILDKLQNKDMQRLTIPDIGQLAGTGHLSQGILGMFDSSGDYDISFRVVEAGTDSNGNPRNARTVKDQGTHNWTVTLDDDYVNNATQLSIARTVIHESVHAYMGYALSLSYLLDMASDLSNYRLELLTNGTNYSQSELDNLTTHNFMSQFVEGIAHSLSVWDNGLQNIDYYKTLAWAGLESSPIYLAQPNKTDIQNAITNENTGNNNAKGEKCP